MRFHALSVGLAILCTESARMQAPVTFEDVTGVAGITWESRNELGAGGAFLDYDGDGWQDILLAGGDGSPALYRNLGDGRFADVTAAAGLDRPLNHEWYISVTVGDYDNDGDPDVYLGVNGPNVLFRNEGDGTFADVTTPALAGNAYTAAAAFGDFDADGWLDLYVGNNVAGFNFPYHTPDPNVLLRNVGNGSFADVTEESGVAGGGCTLAVSWSDYDGDGDLDLWVANDFGEYVESNLLYRNDGPGPDGWVFSEVSEVLGADARIYSMGVAAGDFDRDLDLDYYFSNLGQNLFLRNDEATRFVDVSNPTRTGNKHDPTDVNHAYATGWGVGFNDFDLDGWLDLYVSNGHIPLDCHFSSFECRRIINGIATPNALFHHDGAPLTFTEIGNAAGIAHRGRGRGAAFADFDRDGAVDILQLNAHDRPILYRNTSPDRGSWLKVRVRGRSSARDGIGARVQLDLDDFSLIREVNRNYSFISSSEPAVSFGLGQRDEIPRLQVSWPSGISHQVHYLPANQLLTVVEPSVTVGPGSGISGPVVAGRTSLVTLELVNHTGVSQPVWHVPQVRVLGKLLWSGPVSRVTVPGSGSAGLVHSLNIPMGSEGLQVEFLWAVYDAAGPGLDQMKAAFEIQGGLLRSSHGGSSSRGTQGARR